jgi:caffeoyl-CoA O-methyltransferase
MFDQKLSNYLDDLAESHDTLLREMESLAAETRFPIVGNQVGRLLYVLTASSGARRIIELGSGFGYSAYWFARAMGKDGLVILTDYSMERLQQAQEFLSRAGLRDRAQFESGDALEALRNAKGSFDIIFNDIDKELYHEVLPLAAERLRPGGLLICDNMLWHGRVLKPDPSDAATQAVLRLTRELYRSPDFLTTLMPVRDGISVSVRL